MTTKPRKTTGSTPTTPKVTSAAAWRSNADQGMIITLPSGNAARLKRTLNLPELLKKGKIPNPLAPIISEMLSQKKTTLAVKEQDGEAMMQMLDLVDSQIPNIFIEPKVQMEPTDWDDESQGEWAPDDDALALSDIDVEDRLFAFAFAQGGPADAGTFREQSQKALADLADVSDVEREAERLGGVV